MSRIRTIKPEFWTSEQIVECSTNARLLFIGLWNFCDDCGRHTYSPKQIKALVFPADDFTILQIAGFLEELETNDLIRRYEVEGKQYLYVTGWKHQKIDKPQPAKFPEPSSNDRRMVSTEGSHKGTIEEDISSSLRSDDSTRPENPPAAPAIENPPIRKPIPKPPDAEAELLADGVSPQALADWKTVRKNKRSGPITRTVVDALRREALKANLTLNQSVTMAAECGWQGFRADWVKPQARAGPSGNINGNNNLAEAFLNLGRKNERDYSGPSLDLAAATG